MILDFRARSESRPDTPAQAHAAEAEPRDRAEPIGAQIIIFPGVRRERHGDPPKPQRRKSRTRRDRLELPD
jgi:hypothetical protein